MSTENDQVFIMRFWREAGFDNPKDPRRWRVRVSHVNSGKHFHAADIKKAFRKIGTILNSRPPKQDQAS